MPFDHLPPREPVPNPRTERLVGYAALIGGSVLVASVIYGLFLVFGLVLR